MKSLVLAVAALGIVSFAAVPAGAGCVGAEKHDKTAETPPPPPPSPST